MDKLILTREEIERLREKLIVTDQALSRRKDGMHSVNELPVALNGVLLLSRLMLHVLDTMEEGDKVAHS